MEKLYNTIFIVDISQNPDEVETVSSRIQQLIEDHGGILKKNDRWGKRRLAYPINKKSHGFYVEIEFSANSRLNIPKILQNEFRLNDRVLRSMSYIVEKKELTQRERTAGRMKKKESKPFTPSYKSENLTSEEYKIDESESLSDEKTPENEKVSQDKQDDEKTDQV